MSRKNKSAASTPSPLHASTSSSLVWLPFVAAGWALFAFVVYLQRQNVLPFDMFVDMVDRLTTMGFFHAYTPVVLRGMVVAVIMALVAYQLGSFLAKRLLGSDLPVLERWTIGSALGYGALALLTFLLGVAHLWQARVFAGVLVALALFFLIKERTPWQDAAGVAAAPGPWRKIWIVMLVLFFLLFFLGELTPEIFYDALYYHIAVPNLYHVSGRVVDVPTMLFSNFVLTVQWLFGLAMTLGGEVAAKLTHGVSAFLILLSFLAFEKKYFTAGSGWVGAVLFLGMPIVGINVITTGTDVGWSFFQIAATLALMHALLNPSTRAWILAGCLTGLAASCKYPGLPFIPIACLLIVWKRRGDDKAEWSLVVREVFLFGACATAMTLPLLIRNTVFHGNPLYPFGGTHIGHPRIDPHYWTIFVNDAHTRSLSREFSSFSSFFQYLTHPWNITLTGNDNGTWIGPLYLMLLPLLFWVKSPTPAFRWLRRHTALLWLLWMLTTETPRYGLPTLGMAALLMGEALVGGLQRTWARPVLLFGVLVGSLINWGGLLAVVFNQQGWRVVGGQISKDAYLGEMAATYPTPPYSAYAWMNANLPKEAAVLIVGEARSHYLQRRSIPSSVPDPQPLVVYAKASSSPEEMAQRLRADGVTHIFLNFMEATRTEGYGLFPFDETSWRILDGFWKKNVELSWKEERFDRANPKALYVFRVMSPEESAKAHEPPPNPFERWRPKATS